MTKDALILIFAEAIAHYEGFYEKAWMFDKPGLWPTVAKRNNNPGNIRSWGNNPIEKGYVKFPNVIDGFRALRKQIERNIFERQLTMLEFFGGQRKENGQVIFGGYPGYAPAADMNHPEKYARFVQGFLLDRGVPAESIREPLYELVKE